MKSAKVRAAGWMLAAVLWPLAAGAVPGAVQYQGRLLDAGGNLVNGSVNVSVAVYTNETAGSSVYSETVGSVTVSDGLYAFSFGGGAGFDAALAKPQCWLQLTVNGAALAPRQRLSSVPYARRAGGTETVGSNTVFAAGVVPGAAVANGAIDGNRLASGAVRDLHVAADAAIAGTKVAQATTGARGTVQLAANGETAADKAVQANDSRLGDARAPTGAAGGDLSGTYPTPQIASGAIVDADVSAAANIAGTKVAVATTGARGTVQLAANGETAADKAVQANDSRLGSGGGGGGWTDDGAVVRLTTGTDAVGIGTAGPLVGKVHAETAGYNAVYGNADRYGVYGNAAWNGVYGNASLMYGVYGYSAQDIGVAGQAAQNYGVYGSAQDKGVYGYAAWDNGVCGYAGSWYGVYGYAGYRGGVFGNAYSMGVGGYAEYNQGVYGWAPYMGVQGEANTYGVYGNAQNYGVYGNANLDIGVYGWAGKNYGVVGQAWDYYGVYGSADYYGVYGDAVDCGVYGNADYHGVYGNAGIYFGVYGEAADSYGVYGVAQQTGVAGIALYDNGVYGHAWGNFGVHGNAAQFYGVYGEAPTFGVYGIANDYGGAFVAHSGNGVYCGGDMVLQMGSNVRWLNGAYKAFTIDHPLDPAGAILRHFCAEGPEALVLYTGTATLDATGEAVVDLPDYFSALARNPRVQLTPVGTPVALALKERFTGNQFAVLGPVGVEFDWQVTAERDDPKARLEREQRPVEQLKGTPGAPAVGEFVSDQ